MNCFYRLPRAGRDWKPKSRRAARGGRCVVAPLGIVVQGLRVRILATVRGPVALIGSFDARHMIARLVRWDGRRGAANQASWDPIVLLVAPRCPPPLSASGTPPLTGVPPPTPEVTAPVSPHPSGPGQDGRR